MTGEKSPYLLQHACNPVDWYPWGKEAFRRAEAEDKPIFLSVGYSTCHWCHVMAHECFEDEEVAARLNRDFVCIKADREERPDVDGYYMNVCQMLTGSGGWPLSVFLDPHGRAFFAGTYFPKEDRPGMTGFLSLLAQIAQMWRTGRPRIDEWAEQIRASAGPKAEKPGPVDLSLPGRVFTALQESFDPVWGGFSHAPKFPSPQNLLFLLRYAAAGKREALELCEKTLSCMRRGGIYDQIGFGFSRYSTDGRWLIPHFEKMLTDNALLCLAYTECWQMTRKPVYRRTAEEILQYLTGRMRSGNGGFYTAEDADSEGEEGKYYAFAPEELRRVLGPDAEEFGRLFGVTERGNFHGKSVPNLLAGEIPAEKFGFAEECRKKVLAYRTQRVPPFLDDKILVSRNGLAIAALSLAGRVFGEKKYLSMAEETAAFLSERMVREDGSLLSVFRDGPGRTPGFAEDYACLIFGLTELYLADQEERWLRDAMRLEQVFAGRFEDRETGGFFSAEAGAEHSPAQSKEIFDSSLPSANALHAYNLIRLSRLSGNEGLERRAVRTLEAFSRELGRVPEACPTAASAVLYLGTGGMDVTLTARDPEQLAGMYGVLNGGYRPFLTVRRNPSGSGSPEAGEKPAAYVCAGHVCFPPVSSPEELKVVLERKEAEFSKRMLETGNMV